VAPEILSSSNHRRYTRAVDVWSAGVVLYICLCGFPPFSDELYSKDNPYTLSQQIKLGRFDYPSPYWDPVSDLALDLIDRMLTVDVERRITIEGCLEHPWITGQDPTSFMAGLGPASMNPSNNTQSSNGDSQSQSQSQYPQSFSSNLSSTASLTGQMRQLDFSKRKVHRERTLLSSLNDVKLARTIEVDAKSGEKLHVWAKNAGDDHSRVTQPSHHANGSRIAEAGKDESSDGKDVAEFTQMGGDGELFGNDGGSRYVSDGVESTMASVVQERNEEAEAEAMEEG